MGPRPPIQPPRSKKAGEPPVEAATTGRVRRRSRTVTVAVSRDGAALAAAGARSRWPAYRGRFKKA
jgi:hypothetical protein